jgi:teichuronic acid biosynthesis glycosyltransferase TuaH
LRRWWSVITGVIAEWFDWETWEKAARNKPDWSFVLIGHPYDGNFAKIAGRISAFPNMYYLGPKPYHRLKFYLAQFDIATIPFIINNITNACSPVKLFEYMAAGKPVVTSPMQEILKYQSVLTAGTPEAFINRLDEALRLKDDPDYRLVLKREAEANTWRSRAEVLLRNVNNARKRVKLSP